MAVENRRAAPEMWISNRKCQCRMVRSTQDDCVGTARPTSERSGRVPQIIAVDRCGCPGTSNGPQSPRGACPGQSGVAELGPEAGTPRGGRPRGGRPSGGRPGSGRVCARSPGITNRRLVEPVFDYYRFHCSGIDQKIVRMRADRPGRELVRGDAGERARRRRQDAEQEYRDEVYRQWRGAEAAMNGYMLNRTGRRESIDERSLFAGPESRVRKYASPELIGWFESHLRPTRVSWFGSAAERRASGGRRIG